MMIDKLRLKGANVSIAGKNWNEADQYARQALIENKDSIYIPPYDDPLLWDGHSTIIDELVSEGIKPGAIVLSVGGGGLLRGVQLGLERNGWNDVKIFAIETEGSGSYYASHHAKKLVKLNEINSIATSLGALSVTESTLSSRITTIPLLVSDKNCIEGILSFLNDYKMLVEPACGASIFTVYNQRVYQQILSSLDENKNIIVITCGGSIINLELLQEWKKQFQC